MSAIPITPRKCDPAAVEQRHAGIDMESFVYSKDKWMHLGGMAAIATINVAVYMILMSVFPALQDYKLSTWVVQLSATVGLLKEGFDYAENELDEIAGLTPQHGVEAWDFLFTLAGGVIVAIAAALLGL